MISCSWGKNGSMPLIIFLRNQTNLEKFLHNSFKACTEKNETSKFHREITYFFQLSAFILRATS